MDERFAPGRPGLPPQWGEARKDDIGTAVAEHSRVWFTLAGGRLDEVYYPAPDRACVRSLGFAIAGDGPYVEDEAADHAFARPDEAVPLVTIESRHPAYAMTKETIADPRSDVVLQRVRWRAEPGALLYALLEPHLDNAGACTAVVAERFGRTVLAAERDGVALALVCSVPWVATSAGYAGRSDGRTQLREHGTLTSYTRADDGNVVLTGALDREDLVLALGFAHTIDGAVHVATGALARGYDAIRRDYIAGWQCWHDRLARRSEGPLWRRSTCVLKTLEAKHVDGGRVAALAKPWGQSRGDGLSGAYHLVWTRDLVETMGALIAAGARDEARQALTFLQITQRPDGHWPQNMLLDGRRVWRREELDETALPILLIELMRREHLIDDDELDHAWPMIERAADHILEAGPVTPLDRWEDIGGLTPFTVATQTAALATAAVLARDLAGTAYARELQDVAERWDASIERWLYRRGGPLADRLGIAGYYVRARRPGEPFPELELPHLPRTELSPDALALVRFGLRAPTDPRIVDTVRAIDAVLRTSCAGATAWRRYPGDHYGEHRDGAPFDGHGVGRSWPLLVGERAHYELACGHRDRAEALRRAMEQFAGPTGMLPEQVWDRADVGDLHEGQATHSAAPLGWSHAEYVKLCRSLADDKVFDAPVTLVRRSPHATRAVARPPGPGGRAR